MDELVVKNQDHRYLILFLEKALTEKNLSHFTIQAYKNDLEKFLLFINKINIDLAKVFISKYCWVDSFLKKKSFVETTLARKISVLRQFFNFLYTENYIEVNPAINILAP